MKILLFTIAICILVLLLICNFPLAFVEGNSMYPTYQDGSILLTTRLFNIENLKVGDICVYQRTEDVLVIKRITGVDEVAYRRKFYFEGDNPTESYDSRHYGYVDEEKIVAKVIWKIKH